MKWPMIFAAATAFFWGCYGPVLGQARSGLQSPFKPYLMIGIAYLIIGIGGGLIGMWYKGDSFSAESLMNAGAAYGLFAGALGAAGAFTLTLAMFSGGTAMPHLVMPIVFGGAVTVTGIYSAIQEKKLPMGMVVGIVIVLVGIVLVTANTPQAHPPQKAPAPGPSTPT